MVYDFKSIEQKWQKYWEDNKTFKVTEDLGVSRDHCLLHPHLQVLILP